MSFPNFYSFISRNNPFAQTSASQSSSSPSSSHATTSFSLVAAEEGRVDDGAQRGAVDPTIKLKLCSVGIRLLNQIVRAALVLPSLAEGISPDLSLKIAGIANIVTLAVILLSDHTFEKIAEFAFNFLAIANFSRVVESSPSAEIVGVSLLCFFAVDVFARISSIVHRSTDHFFSDLLSYGCHIISMSFLVAHLRAYPFQDAVSPQEVTLAAGIILVFMILEDVVNGVTFLRE